MKDTIIEQLSDKIDNLEQFLLLLIFLLGVNIITAITKLIADKILKKSDIKIFKQTKVLERDMEIQEELYRMLEKMTLYLPQSEEDSMLSSISETERFVTNNSLFISKPIKKQTILILDYFKSILADYRKKDYAQETKLLNEFINTYRK